ncbi:inositol monophosphatase [Chitiniphilus purpureus]|uniref:Inositol monophosphatase n=1 Tax=Chitiniphilus purpureus TaxID=2981137 RepID=A0ABY6DMZ0_9NEIS|nr:inositol monophosphatase [Chitiniphilus sp. CD1]UXY15724.1 inositol monophosphatase [Chitiniphilus sp. CD1]
MSPPDSLTRLCRIARQVAADEIMPRFLSVTIEKKHDGTLFTEADLATQRALTRLLPELVPCPVLGEEMSEAHQQALWQENPDGLWVVDPIDGTTNFAHGLPYFAVSIALMRQGRPVLGVVYLPVLQECFAAAAGQGAWMNDVPLPFVTEEVAMADAVAIVEPKWLGGHLPTRVATVAPFGSFRNFGASTVDWCYLAAGRVDLLLHGSQKLWDYAAGALIAAEAGCHYATLSSDDYWSHRVWGRSLVAARTAALFESWKAWARANR